MDLNEFDCQLLDEVLTLLSWQNSLNHNQLMEMFDNDGVYAAAMLEVLVNKGLVDVMGH